MDGANNRIRKVNAAGIITTVAGGGTAVGTGDGGLATNAQIFPRRGGGRRGQSLNCSRRLDPQGHTAGILSTVAGGILPGFAGDGGPATKRSDDRNRRGGGRRRQHLYCGFNQQRIRKVNMLGSLARMPATEHKGFSGDGGPATSAALALPQGLAVDSVGNLYFAVVGRIRNVDTAGIITTVAGNGSALAIGDGGPAINAGMTSDLVAVDKEGISSLWMQAAAASAR